MSPDLEQRRLAVVHALRSLADAPALPTRPDTAAVVDLTVAPPAFPDEPLIERMRDVEHQVAAIRLQLAHVMSRLDDRRPADAQPDAVDRLAVPAVESVGTMSAVASRALFGV